MALHDRIAKVDRGYTDRDSIVYMDGREWLQHDDWKRRKQELWERCEKRCELVKYSNFTMKMERCRATFASIEEMHPHHKMKRSDRHDDRLDNLQALCFQCHKREHPEKNKLHWKGANV